MELDVAHKIVRAYGGFLECLQPRLDAIFFIPPEASLPYPLKTIEVAFSVAEEFYKDQGNKKMIESIHVGWACLTNGYKNDGEFITQIVKNFNDKKWISAYVEELIKNYRKDKQFYVLGFFKEIPFNQVDFNNLDSYSAGIVVEIYIKYIKHAHSQLSLVFNGRIPESILSFPKEDIAKALTFYVNKGKSEGNKEDADAWSISKTVLDEYVIDEVAIKQLIKNFSEKENCERIVSHLRDFKQVVV